MNVERALCASVCVNGKYNLFAVDSITFIPDPNANDDSGTNCTRIYFG